MKADRMVNLSHVGNKHLSKAGMRIVDIPLRTWIGIHGFGLETACRMRDQTLRNTRYVLRRGGEGRDVLEFVSVLCSSSQRPEQHRFLFVIVRPWSQTSHCPIVTQRILVDV